MGLFGSSSSPPPPKISSDGAPIAPDRSQRAKCWEGRDLYFQCLDKNNIIDSINEKGKADKACGSEHKLFEQNCASSWVGCGFRFCDGVEGCGCRNKLTGCADHILQEEEGYGIPEGPDIAEVAG